MNKLNNSSQTFSFVCFMHENIVKTHLTDENVYVMEILFINIKYRGNQKSIYYHQINKQYEQFT